MATDGPEAHGTTTAVCFEAPPGSTLAGVGAIAPIASCSNVWKFRANGRELEKAGDVPSPGYSALAASVESRKRERARRNFQIGEFAEASAVSTVVFELAIEGRESDSERFGRPAAVPADHFHGLQDRQSLEGLGALLQGPTRGAGAGAR